MVSELLSLSHYECSSCFVVTLLRFGFLTRALGDIFRQSPLFLSLSFLVPFPVTCRCFFTLAVFVIVVVVFLAVSDQWPEFLHSTFINIHLHIYQ